MAEGQLVIPGSVTKQEQALDEEMDGWISCADKIAALRDKQRKHKENVDELMKVLGLKKRTYEGRHFERGMRLTIKKAHDELDGKDEDGAKLPKAKKDDGSQDADGYAPLSSASKKDKPKKSKPPIQMEQPGDGAAAAAE